MKTILMLFFMFFACLSHAQTVEAKTKLATVTTLTATASKTAMVYKGLPVYKSSKGSLFCLKQSKKTGNWYKVYVEIKKP